MQNEKEVILLENLPLFFSPFGFIFSYIIEELRINLNVVMLIHLFTLDIKVPPNQIYNEKNIIIALDLIFLISAFLVFRDVKFFENMN